MVMPLGEGILRIMGCLGSALCKRPYSENARPLCLPNTSFVRMHIGKAISVFAATKVGNYRKPHKEPPENAVSEHSTLELFGCHYFW